MKYLVLYLDSFIYIYIRSISIWYLFERMPRRVDAVERFRIWKAEGIHQRFSENIRKIQPKMAYVQAV